MQKEMQILIQNTKNNKAKNIQTWGGSGSQVLLIWPRNIFQLLLFLE